MLAAKRESVLICPRDDITSCCDYLQKPHCGFGPKHLVCIDSQPRFCWTAGAQSQLVSTPLGCVMLIYRTGWFFFAAGVWITSAHAREVQLITFNEMTDDTREYLDRPRFLKAVYQLQPNQNEPSAISIKRKRRVMNSASRTKSFHYFCAPSKYAPAWWLKPDVELRRAAHYDAVVSIACEFGIPTSLLDAAVAQESGYNRLAVSPAGAKGMLQIMPATATGLGLTNPFDPIANLRAGARYLRQQIDRFGRIDLALAAYNAGPERPSLLAGRVPNIRETREYVRTIVTNWERLIRRQLMLGMASQPKSATPSPKYQRVASVAFNDGSLVR